jgi:hypothetical protein
MPSVNPGPASTSTPSATAVLAPASQPNYGNLYQGSNALRLLAFQKAVNISTTGDVAVLPLINTQNFSFLTAGAGTGVIVVTNPGAYVNGVFTAGSAAACVLRLWSGPAGTGTALCASTTLTGFTGAAAASSILNITSTATGFYSALTWGVSSAASYNIYVNVTTAAASTATQMDMYIYGYDFT